MQSAGNKPPRGLLSFPSVAGSSAVSPTQEDKAIAQVHCAEIHELCRRHSSGT